MPTTSAISGAIAAAARNHRSPFQNHVRDTSDSSPAEVIGEVAARTSRPASRTSINNRYVTADAPTMGPTNKPRTLATVTSVTFFGQDVPVVQLCHALTCSVAERIPCSRPVHATITVPAKVRNPTQTAPNCTSPISVRPRVCPSWRNAANANCTRNRIPARDAPIHAVVGRIAPSGPFARRSGVVNASMMWNANCRTHMPAEKIPTIAASQPSCAAVDTADPSQCTGLRDPQPNATIRWSGTTPVACASTVCVDGHDGLAWHASTSASTRRFSAMTAIRVGIGRRQEHDLPDLDQQLRECNVARSDRSAVSGVVAALSVTELPRLHHCRPSSWSPVRRGHETRSL